MQRMLIIIAVQVLSVAGFIKPVAAEPLTEKDWQAFNHAASVEHILPRYDNLADKSESLSKSVDEFCDNPEEGSLNQARKDFVRAMMAWQAIQHVRFGPVTLLMRDFSMQYWPDRKGIGSKQLRQTLKLQDTDFDEAFFRDASASLQGFPALEKLLFDNEVLTKSADNPTICALSIGISRNIFRISRDIQQDWKQTAADIEIAHEEKEAGEFEGTLDAATLISKSLVEPIEVMRDIKLTRSLSDSPEKARWKRSEFWRSRQSVNSLRVNVQALQHLYNGWDDHSVHMLLEKSGEVELANKIREQFKALTITMADIHEPSPDQVSVEQFTALTSLAEKLRLLQKDLEKAMLALDIHLGFNSRDGD